MNWVLICEKNNRKALESQINSPQVLLGTLTEVDENIYKKSLKIITLTVLLFPISGAKFRLNSRI
jgi:hypothetical protein